MYCSGDRHRLWGAAPDALRGSGIPLFRALFAVTVCARTDSRVFRTGATIFTYVKD
jgi:hypothetical protein